MELNQRATVRRGGRRAAWVGILVAMALARPAAAQSLQQQNQEILRELQQIRQLLEKLAGPLGQPAAPQPAAPVDDKVTLPAVTGFVLGKPDAPVTMVEFTDLQCPFCRQFHLTAFEQLKKNYIDTGKLRYVSVDFPLQALHPLAMAAAKAARCAGEQAKFWEMRHAILVNNVQLSATAFTTFAQDLKLDIKAFGTCVDATSRFDADIQKDLVDATRAGVSATPSFVVGRTSAAGLEGVRVVGAQPYTVFDIKIKELLVPAPAPASP